MPPRSAKKAGTPTPKKTPSKSPKTTKAKVAAAAAATSTVDNKAVVENIVAEPKPDVVVPEENPITDETAATKNEPDTTEVQKDSAKEENLKEENGKQEDAEGTANQEDIKEVELEEKSMDVDVSANKEEESKPDNENADAPAEPDEEGQENREADVEGEDQEEMPDTVKERHKQKEFEVFVGGLDRDATEDDLKNVFSEVGEVLEVRLAVNPVTKKNKGFAFVRFATLEQVKRAVTELKNPKVRGKQCGVERSQDNETLYVRNISRTWTKEALRNKLKDYGLENVQEITLMDDPMHEGKNRGFAFLEFDTHLEATNALKRLQNRDVYFGMSLRVKAAFAKSGIEPDEEVMSQVKSVFIDGLPPAWDEDRVKEKFGKFGEIEQVQLARNMSNAKRKDFGFISFTARDAALACIEGVNNQEVTDGENKVSMRANLRKPLLKTQSSKDGPRGTRGARAPWMRGGGRGIDSRRPGGRSYGGFGRPPAGRFYNDYDTRHTPAFTRGAPSMRGSRSYRNDSYYDRQSRSSRAYEEPRYSSYQDDYAYESSEYPEYYPSRTRVPYPEETYGHQMGSLSQEYRGYDTVSGSKRPYSTVDDSLMYEGRHGRPRSTYDPTPESRYRGPGYAESSVGRTANLYSTDYSGTEAAGRTYLSGAARNVSTYGRGASIYDWKSKRIFIGMLLI